jgi:hypothetical protein
MLKIFRGQLDITHPDIVEKIHNKIRRKPFKLAFREFKKFVYFLQNPQDIFNPITIMIVNGNVLHIHPGNFRLQAAYYRNDQYIDCIFVISDDERSLEKIETISKDAGVDDSIILYKNKSGGWWEINTLQHQELSNDTISRKVFDRTLDQEFEKFKQQTVEFGWPNFYQNANAVSTFEYEDREGIFQSICYALGRNYKDNTKFEIKKYD